MVELALASEEQPKRWRFRLPPAVPPFNTRVHRIFSLVWIAAFLLALIGPAAGIYLRYAAENNNSQLLLGSRAGFAVSPRDATHGEAGRANGGSSEAGEPGIAPLYGWSAVRSKCSAPMETVGFPLRNATFQEH